MYSVLFLPHTGVTESRDWPRFFAVNAKAALNCVAVKDSSDSQEQEDRERREGKEGRKDEGDAENDPSLES